VVGSSVDSAAPRIAGLRQSTAPGTGAGTRTQAAQAHQVKQFREEKLCGRLGREISSLVNQGLVPVSPFVPDFQSLAGTLDHFIEKYALPFRCPTIFSENLVEMYAIEFLEELCD
jgi:hypothetical protein